MIEVCGCAPSVCGGAQPRTNHAGYELPANTTFGGVIKVSYEANDVRVIYARACPPPA